MDKVAKFRDNTYDNYLVSDSGNVYRVKQDGQKKELKPYNNGLGYSVIDFSVDGKVTSAKMHLVVWDSFHTKARKPKYVINHIDHDKSNCALDNLEEITQKDNVALAQVKIKHKEYLSSDKVEGIKKELKTDKTITQIAKDNNVPRHIITDIKRHKTYN